MSTVEELLPPAWLKWQESILRKERVGHLQSLTRGMVHDFRNGLAPVLGYIELLQSTPGLINDPDQVRFFVQSLFSAAKDAQKSLNQLRDFYHPMPRILPVHPTSMGDILKQVADNVFPGQPNRCVANLPADVHIWIKQEILYTLFQEVLENSVRAMHSPSQKVTVSLRKLGMKQDTDHNLGDPVVWGDVPDQSVALVVEDDGCGLDVSTLRYCVEPFFSGRAGGRSGVGLARIWGIMELYEGALVIASRKGKGTRVEFHFPHEYFEERRPTPTGTRAYTYRLKGIGLSEEEQQQIESGLGRKIIPMSGIEELMEQGIWDGRSCWVCGSPISVGLLHALEETLQSLYYKRLLILVRSSEPTPAAADGKLIYWTSVQELVEILQDLEF